MPFPNYNQVVFGSGGNFYHPVYADSLISTTGLGTTTAAVSAIGATQVIQAQPGTNIYLWYAGVVNQIANVAMYFNYGFGTAAQATAGNLTTLVPGNAGIIGPTTIDDAAVCYGSVTLTNAPPCIVPAEIPFVIPYPNNLYLIISAGTTIRTYPHVLYSQS